MEDQSEEQTGSPGVTETFQMQSLSRRSSILKIPSKLLPEDMTENLEEIDKENFTYQKTLRKRVSFSHTKKIKEFEGTVPLTHWTTDAIEISHNSDSLETKDAESLAASSCADLLPQGLDNLLKSDICQAARTEIQSASAVKSEPAAKHNLENEKTTLFWSWMDVLYDKTNPTDNLTHENTSKNLALGSRSVDQTDHVLVDEDMDLTEVMPAIGKTHLNDRNTMLNVEGKSNDFNSSMKNEKTNYFDEGEGCMSLIGMQSVAATTSKLSSESAMEITNFGCAENVNELLQENCVNESMELTTGMVGNASQLNFASGDNKITNETMELASQWNSCDREAMMSVSGVKTSDALQSHSVQTFNNTEAMELTSAFKNYGEIPMELALSMRAGDVAVQPDLETHSGNVMNCALGVTVSSTKNMELTEGLNVSSLKNMELTTGMNASGSTNLELNAGLNVSGPKNMEITAGMYVSSPTNMELTTGANASCPKTMELQSGVNIYSHKNMGLPLTENINSPKAAEVQSSGESNLATHLGEIMEFDLGVKVNTEASVTHNEVPIKHTPLAKASNVHTVQSNSVKNSGDGIHFDSGNNTRSFKNAEIISSVKSRIVEVVELTAGTKKNNPKCIGFASDMKCSRTEGMGAATELKVRKTEAIEFESGIKNGSSEAVGITSEVKISRTETKELVVRKERSVAEVVKANLDNKCNDLEVMNCKRKVGNSVKPKSSVVGGRGFEQSSSKFEKTSILQDVDNLVDKLNNIESEEVGNVKKSKSCEQHTSKENLSKSDLASTSHTSDIESTKDLLESPTFRFCRKTEQPEDLMKGKHLTTDQVNTSECRNATFVVGSKDSDAVGHLGKGVDANRDIETDISKETKQPACDRNKPLVNPVIQLDLEIPPQLRKSSRIMSRTEAMVVGTGRDTTTEAQGSTAKMEEHVLSTRKYGPQHQPPSKLPLTSKRNDIAKRKICGDSPTSPKAVTDFEMDSSNNSNAAHDKIFKVDKSNVHSENCEMASNETAGDRHRFDNASPSKVIMALACDPVSPEFQNPNLELIQNVSFPDDYNMMDVDDDDNLGIISGQVAGASCSPGKHKIEGKKIPQNSLSGASNPKATIDFPRILKFVPKFVVFESMETIINKYPALKTGIPKPIVFEEDSDEEELFVPEPIFRCTDIENEVAVVDELKLQDDVLEQNSEGEPEVFVDELHGQLRALENRKDCLWEIDNYTVSGATFYFLWKSLLLTVKWTETGNSTKIITDAQLTSKLTDSHEPVAHLVHAIVLQCIPRKTLLTVCPTSENLPALLEAVAEEAQTAKILGIDIDLWNNSHPSHLDVNRFTVEFMSRKASICFNVTIERVDKWRFLGPEDVSVESILGSIREDHIQQLMAGIPPTPRIINKFLTSVEQYIQALEL